MHHLHISASTLIAFSLLFACGEDDPQPVGGAPDGSANTADGGENGGIEAGPPNEVPEAGAGGSDGGNGAIDDAGNGADAGGEDGGTDGGGSSSNSPLDEPYAIAYAGTTVGIDTRFPPQAAFTGGELTGFVGYPGEEPQAGTCSVFNGGVDGPLHWGRWADGTLAGTLDDTLSPQQGFHFVIGTETTTLPASGTAVYDLVETTPATLGDGSVALGTVSASASVEFGATTMLGLSVSIEIDGVTYDVETLGDTATPGTSEVTTWDTEHPGRLGGIPVAPSVGVCGGGCSVSVQGFFAGADAERLGIAVHIFPVPGAGGSADSISTVLAFSKQ